MTSIREALRRLIKRNFESKADVHDSAFSYEVHWTKLTLEWDMDRRQRVHNLVQKVIDNPNFIANEYERIYSFAEIDLEKHSGASLVALEKVLASLTNENSQKE